MSQSQPISTALIGFGLSARVFHLPFIQCQAGFSLTAVSTSQQNEASSIVPDVKLFRDAQSLIQQSDSELVVITAPNQFHYPLAKQALMMGKHVILEKPLVLTVAEGEELILLARQSGKILAPFHNRRWDGDFLTLQQLISEDVLGQIKGFESHFDRFRPQPRQRWREQAGPGSGILYDLGPHLIDQALALFGWPQAISATLKNSRDSAETCDYFHLQLHYADKEVLLHADAFSAGPKLRFKLQGDRGTYLKYGMDPQEERLRAGKTPDRSEWAAEDENHYGTLYQESGEQVIATQTGGYQYFYQEVANAIRYHAPLTVSADNALDSIRLIELAQRSHQAGQRLTLTS
ncbi:oxidoreductase [Saliniradius amylolyticus]|nr:oxidoreductase [Saliniradius amylolyticus]